MSSWDSATARSLPLAVCHATAGGRVAFVSAGPGDPGLLTVRAERLLRAADVIAVDDVAMHALAAEVVPGARVMFPELGDADRLPPPFSQRLLAEARTGAFVVRLVPGDAMLDASIVAELTACNAAGIDFDVVPGVPLATGIAAYAGVPMGACLSGHVRVVDLRPGRGSARDLYAADHVESIVAIGCRDRIVESADALIQGGRPVDTAVSVTADGTTIRQATLVTTLGQVHRELRYAEPDAVLVATFGEAAQFQSQLSWFETKPLFGWRVLMPTTKEPAEDLVRRLTVHGAITERVPTVSVEPPRNPQQVDKAIRGLVEGRYEWLVLTSVNALRAVTEKLFEYGLDARAFAGVRVAAVGEDTVRALAGWGINADLAPVGEQSVRALLDIWPEYDVDLDPIDRVLVPKAGIATETLAAGLVELGWQVDDVTAFRTVRASPPPAPIREAIKTAGFDAVVFTSVSTVRNLVGIAGKPHAATVVACIGPQTARAAEEHGLTVSVVAPEPTPESLAEALAVHGAGLRLAAIEAGEQVLRPSQRRRGARKTGTLRRR